MSKSILTLGFLCAGLLSAWAGDDKEVDEAMARFRKSFANPSAPARAAAVTELGATPAEKTAAAIGGLLSTDADPVRIAAAAALGGFRDYKKLVTPMLLNALNANVKEPKVMEAIFKGLGKLSDETALPTIHRYFEDKDKDVANAALMSAAEIRSVSSIDLIIQLMNKYEKVTEQVKKSGGGGGAYGVNIPGGGGGDDPKAVLAKAVLPTTVKAMQGITKEKWATSKEWQIWWGRYKATFKIDK